jgi:hypothetical protein
MSLVQRAELGGYCRRWRLEIGRGTAEAEERREGPGRDEACDGSQTGEGADCDSEGIERLDLGEIKSVKSVGQDKQNPAHAQVDGCFPQLLALFTIRRRYDPVFRQLTLDNSITTLLP